MSDQDNTAKRALLLGAGMVAPPLISYLLDRGVELTVAANNPDRATELLGGSPKGIAVDWQIDDLASLDQMIDDAEIVISLLPATMHVQIAERCVAKKRHFASTSYVSEEMRALHEPAQEAGVVLLNEAGVDPGIDHMSAVKVFDQVRERDGGEITGFRSFCGGLPAPDANDNPWGYKFSWNPLGVLRASRNSARYLLDGVLVELAAGEVFEKGGMLTVGGFEFESYANRDSMAYVELYRLQSATSMYRGTLRWPGWSETITALSKLNLLSDAAPQATWRETLTRCAELKSQVDIATATAERLAIPSDSAIIKRFEWLGLFDAAQSVPAAPTVIAALAEQMQSRMAFGPGQRDMLVMHHIFDFTVGGVDKQSTSTMVAYGDPDGATAMAKTVGYPAAIGAKMILDGVFTQPGVQIPVIPTLYEPILNELETLGITLVEEAIR